jgi:hypothetical protein
MDTKRIETVGLMSPADTARYQGASGGPKFLVRHQGPNRHQRRKLAKIKDPVARLALLNQIVHRVGLAGNGDRSLVRR